VRTPKESGKVHSNIKDRFQNGDREVVDAMSNFAGYALEARDALVYGDKLKAVKLMDDNFSLRQRLYGDKLIGEQTFEIVAIARKHGHSVKLSGSGGCVIGCWAQESNDIRALSIRALRKELEVSGYVFCPLAFAIE
jgi:glucuronokinase